MSDESPFVRLIVEQVDLAIFVCDDMSAAHAKFLREDKIDWVSANGRIFNELLNMESTTGALTTVLLKAGLMAEYMACKQKIAAASARNVSLTDDLLANNLLSGPKRVPA